MPWSRRLGYAITLVMTLGSAAVQADAPTTPAAVADAFHRGLREADGRAALVFMARDVLVFEQGFSETGRDNYARNQLQEANRFAKSTQRRVLSRQSGIDGQSAWVITTTITTGKFEDRALSLEGTETMLLRLEQDDWKISHIHWSAHPSDPADEAGSPPALPSDSAPPAP